ncbi:MAG: hypothetical protein E5Y69_35685, partial [Mesorhizobium sp.]
VQAPDTTGAGDSFDAGFALGLSRGLDWVGSARLAVALASEVLKQPASRRYLTPRDLETLDLSVACIGEVVPASRVK